MQVRDVMTDYLACCTPETSLQEVAQLMVQYHCGAIPVVENQQSKKLVGIITDRDITCRTVAQGKNPVEMKAGDVMSQPVATVTPETDLGECCRIMEEDLVRRVPVVDAQGCCCGIVAQADIARKAGEHETAELVEEISEPTEEPRRVGCC